MGARISSWLALSLCLAACAEEEASPQVDVLVRGSMLPGSNGMAFAPDGRLYVAGAFANRISVVDVERGDVVDTIGSDGSVVSPDDVAVASDGTLYWTSLLTGVISIGKSRRPLLLRASNPLRRAPASI